MDEWREGTSEDMERVQQATWVGVATYMEVDVLPAPPNMTAPLVMVALHVAPSSPGLPPSIQRVLLTKEAAEALSNLLDDASVVMAGLNQRT